MCKVRVSREIHEMDAFQFIISYIEQYDLSLLQEFKIQRSEGNDYLPGVWGNSRRMESPVTGEIIESYGCRISCLYKGDDNDFPGDPAIYRPKKKGKYGGLQRKETMYDNLQDLILYIAGHEFWHFLAATKQVEGNTSDEYAAWKAGHDLVKEFHAV